MEEDCGLFFVQEFIKGMLNKELTWFPQKGMEVETGLVTLEVPCWRCKKTTQVVAGLEVKNQTKTFKKFYDFKEVSETILSMISPNIQAKYKIGTIKKDTLKPCNSSISLMDVTTVMLFMVTSF